MRGWCWNHIHLIAQSENISKDIARFKAFTAKKIIAYLTERNAKTILDQLKYYKKVIRGKIVKSSYGKRVSILKWF